MSKIPVWMEGYAATGEHGPAQLLGEYEADNFDQAVSTYLFTNPGAEEHYSYKDGKHYIWACQLFDNEKDARKSFG